MYIGVFDSGLGGLTILKEFFKKLPRYDYIYLGDNARVPYGGRSSETIYQFTKKAVDFLFSKNCALVILACNTSTSNALKKLQHEYLPIHYPDRRVLGIIKPVVEYITNGKANHRIGVIGTRATVQSHSFTREINKLFPKAIIIEQACPLLVPILEEGEQDWEGTDMLLHKYLEPLLKQNIDTLILACTHYELLEKQIQNIVGDRVRVLSEGKLAAEKLADYLGRYQELEKRLSKNKMRRFYVTDLTERFTQLTSLFMEQYFTQTDKLELVNIT